eukprot:311882-Rhodomonas_salina.1
MLLREDGYGAHYDDNIAFRDKNFRFVPSQKVRLTRTRLTIRTQWFVHSSQNSLVCPHLTDSPTGIHAQIPKSHASRTFLPLRWPTPQLRAQASRSRIGAAHPEPEPASAKPLRSQDDRWHQSEAKAIRSAPPSTGPAGRTDGGTEGGRNGGRKGGRETERQRA